MERLPFFHILMVMAVMIWQLGGCARDTDYDQQLTGIDHLMHDHPDSALTLLSSLDPERMRSDGDRAYHALLLTEARYKNYQVATSDSLINIALDYYTRHQKEREKLTRALTYKGAVMEELGQPQEAMRHLKKALSTVKPDDYFNQGYIRLRMGQLYNDYYVLDSLDVTLFKEAQRYFELVPDSFYTIACLCQIGTAYIKTNQDSVMPYLRQAYTLAKQMREKDVEHVALERIASMKMLSHNPQDIDSAKVIALSILHDNDRVRADDGHWLMIAATALAKQGKSDSAHYYLNQVSTQQMTPQDWVLYYQCMTEAAIGKGDIKSYQHYFEKAHDLSDSLVSNAVQFRLKEVDARYDNEVLKNENLRKQAFIARLTSVGIILAAILGLAILLLTRRASRRKHQLKEKEDYLEQMREDYMHMKSQLEANQEMNESLKKTIRNQIDIFSRLVDEHYKLFTTHPEKFNEIFMQSYSAKQPTKSFWNGIRTYADSASNGFVSHAVSLHPTMTDSDVRFLSLYVCDLPTSVIMICMGYGNLRSTYNKKRHIANLLSSSDNLDQCIVEWKQHAVAEVLT